MKKYLLVVLGCTVFLASSAWAVLPNVLPYQGRLTQADGAPYIPGIYALKFALTDSSGNQILWSNDGSTSLPPSVSDSVLVGINGVFSISLGNHHPIADSVWSRNQLWLRVWFDPGTGFEEILPSQRVVPAGSAHYADNASNALLLDGQNGSFYRSWSNLTNIPSGFSDGTDNIGRLYEAVVAADGTGDFTTLQAAVNSGARSIFLRHGVYTITGDINLQDSTILIGENQFQTIINGHGAINCGNNNSFIRFTENGTAGTSIFYSTGSHNLFSEMLIQTTSNTGIISGTCTMVSNCRISTGAFPITLGDSSTVYSCEFTGSNCRCSIGSYSRMELNRIYTSGSWASAAITSGTNCQISNNLISSETSQRIGISVEHGCIITGNTIERFSAGISVSDGDGEIIIQGNSVRECGGTAFSISASTNLQSYMQISDNVAYNPGGMGFNLSGGNRVSLTGNKVYSAGTDGIYVSSGVTENVLIANNTVRNSTGIGFNLSGGSWSHSKWSVNGNQSDANGSDGYRIFADDAAIVCNTATSNSGIGFNFPAGMENSTFTGNVASYNTGNSFYATGAPAVYGSSIGNNVFREAFFISGQLMTTAITGNAFQGGVTSFGSPQSQSVITNNVP